MGEIAASLDILSKYHRLIVKRCEEAGFVFEEARSNNKVFVKGNVNGHPVRWSWSKTPSTQSAFKALIGQIKRDFRVAGVEPPTIPIRGTGGRTPAPTAPLDGLWLVLNEVEDLLSPGQV
jgi:hypothetical protein